MCPFLLPQPSHQEIDEHKVKRIPPLHKHALRVLQLIRF